jgi:4-diphosphocytidyl-2-C-methyl-D-erythritol kinase
VIRERAPAKVNLILQVGRQRDDGLHDICSIFASLGLADELTFVASESGRDEVICPGVDGDNLVSLALRLFRERANELAGRPLDPTGLRALGTQVGADVPSQVQPRHALVTGAGEHVERLRLPTMGLVLLPSDYGLSTAEVYREADRIESTREQLDPEKLRALAAGPLTALAAGVENDLQAAAASLRPEVGEPIERLREAGALAAALSGSGPTAFGVFSGPAVAERAAADMPSAIVTRLAAP